MNNRTADTSRKLRRPTSTLSTSKRLSNLPDRSHAGLLPHTPLWIFAALLLAALVVISILAQPIADDFLFLAHVPHQSMIGNLHAFYLHRDGRFANAIVEIAGVKLFGALVIKVMPLLEITALDVASTWLLWQLLGMGHRRLERAALLGSAFTGVVLLAVPSIFDSVAWCNASMIYTASLVGVALDAAMYVYLYKHRTRRWYHYALFALLVFLCQGFNEPIAVITCLGASVLLLHSLLSRHKAGIKVKVTLWMTAVAGLAVVYFSPATHERAKVQHVALNFHAVFISSLRDFWFTKNTLLSWRVALIVVLGLAFALAIPTLSVQARKRLGAVGVAFCVLPTYITGVLTHYANSIEHDMTPTRTATVPFGFLVAGLVCLIIVLVHSLPDRLHRRLALSLSVAIPVSLAVSLVPVLNVIRAEVLRDSLLRYREASLQAQLAAHQQTIYVIPAPILLNDSQADDLSYVEDHPTYWPAASLVVDYYGLQGKTVKIANTPPPGYCLTHSDAAQWGAYTCQADAQVQAVPYAPNVPATR